MTSDILIIIGALYGAIGVIFGAFGAHLLKEKLAPDVLKSFETGVRYQLFHAIVLLVIGYRFDLSTALQQAMGWSFIAGIFLFSFSIYGLCLSSTTGKKLTFLGPITPLGGLLLILGWIFLVMISL